MSHPSKRVACPSCGTEVIWNAESKSRPFCSERCRMIDLGKWFEEEHRIPVENNLEAVSLQEDPQAQ